MKPVYQLTTLAFTWSAALNTLAQADVNQSLPELSPAAETIQAQTDNPSHKAIDEILVSARRREEAARDVPIPISIINGTLLEDTGGFNVNRLKELIPSVQLYSSNPRNTGLSIRGLGTTFGLTNDGIDPGVGFYVDGVFYARPAVTTLDFIDVEQIEVLRGPQGTLFGKNTTAGAFNVTTRKPEFTPAASFELNTGNYNFVQTRGSVTGPLNSKLAARLAFSLTERDGLLKNIATGERVNNLDNKGVRAQVLWSATDNVELLFAADVTRQRPNGYAQVFAGVAPTLRAPYRQFEAIIADLGYEPPSRNPFDRVIDQDTPWKSDQDLGGLSLNVDVAVGAGTLSSTTAWRYWNWSPSNDRDFTGLPALSLSQAPSRHDQWSQELRWAGDLDENLSGVFGMFAIRQELAADPAHREEAGSAQWRFAQNSTSALWQTPGLFEGFGINSYPSLDTFSGAIFGQLEWQLSDRLRVLPGLRFNYDKKAVDFSRLPYGGLQTSDPALLALKNSIYSAQAFTANIEDDNVTGQLSLAYDLSAKINAYASYSTSFKPVGLNLGGLPSSNGRVMTELAVIRPESVQHYEIGLKTSPLPRSTLNFVYYRSNIEDYQTQVQTADLAVNRGYLSNAEEARVQGFEIDSTLSINNSISLYASLAYTDGKYVSFINAPPPLEETGGPTFKDISGSRLPGISLWVTSIGGEYVRPLTVLNSSGEFFLGIDTYYRSEFSSSPSPSRYLTIDGYTLANTRFGFRANAGWSAFLWARNLFNRNYFEQLLPGSGNAGHYAAVLGDPRTWGATLRYSF